VVLSEKDSPPLATHARPDRPSLAGARVDLEGIGRRVAPLPFPAARYTNLKAGRNGALYAVESLEAPASGGTIIHRLGLNQTLAGVLVAGVTDFALSAAGDKTVWRQSQQWFISDAGERVTLAVDGIEVRSDPRAEWKQIYREAWRLVRDFFYDSNYHGLDLAAASKRYEIFLDRLASRRDLNYLLAEALGNLSVGHLSIGSGEESSQERAAATGLLGADYRIEDGRYRIARIFRGENWNLDIVAPLAQPGMDVSAGDFVSAVNGRELRASDSIFQVFEGTAGKPTAVLVAATANGERTRELTVVPIADESGLRHTELVEANRQRVDAKTNGRVAYIYLPNTAEEGARRFLREFYAQADKQAAIIDERFNGGGEHATDIVEYLVRKPMNFTTTRSGADFPQPSGVAGPKVMIINEFAGSGGDLLPWYFRRANAGKLVGKRTGGAVIGLWGADAALY
jgi:tricorn protease